ncbi:uncharacterized protein ARMOST_17082 [Armillaria ostoyae]|uniref:DUF6534 domain-containing protein n=1 Tax=Armillaria ostoyae TaxID=47428 RepID=A0A284RY06_ARMOS|nr:uncharacterized protein ARMOST_17082 [Armillaria ostoyae]
MSSPISDPFGGVLVSVFLSILLLGAMFVQLFIYFDHYPKDHLWIKVFVLVLFALDILNSVFVLAWVYKMLIDNFGNIEAFMKGNHPSIGGSFIPNRPSSTADWTAATDPLLSGIMSGMVQFFFAWKIWVLTKNYFFILVIGACALASTAGGIATSTIAFMVWQTVDWPELRVKLDTPALVWLIPAAVCDLIIAIIITVYLQRAKGPFKRTNRILNRVIRRLLTATIAVVDLVLILAIKDTPYYLFVAFILPKLYTNSAMSSLNSRHIQHNDIEDDITSLSMVSGFWGSSPGRASPLTARPHEMFVNVEYGRHQDSDRRDAETTVSSEDIPKHEGVGPCAMFVQLYIYFDRYPKSAELSLSTTSPNLFARDNIWLKVFVIVLFALDVLNSIFVLMWVYKLLIDNFGNLVAFTKADWTATTDPLLAGIMAGMVQGFFAWKIWVLTKNYYYVGVIVICALTSSAGGIATSIIGFLVINSVDWSELRNKLDAPSLVWLIPAALGDLIIAVVITMCLQRAKGSIRRTNRILNRIIRLTMQNGLLTATVAIIDLGLILGVKASVEPLSFFVPSCLCLQQRQPYYLCVAFILPKLYTNSALSSLNARRPHTQDIGDEAAAPTMPWNSTEGHAPPRSQGQVFISVEYESHEMRDARNQKNVSMALSDDSDTPEDKTCRSV